MSTNSHIALMQAIPLDAAAEPDAVPEWVHLLPNGTLQGSDGRGPYSADDLAAIIAASGSRKLPIDENHSIDIAGPRGEPSPARGHIVEMQARADGIWGRVEWNASGRVLMAEKAYSGISPVITHELHKNAAGSFNVTGILRASMTNRPNLPGMIALHQQEPQMSLAAIAKSLGLGEDASEADILAAIQKSNGGAASATALQSAIGNIGVALGVDAGASSDAVLMAAKLAKQGDTTLSEQVVALQSQLDGLKEAGARKSAEDFVDGEAAKGATAVNEGTRNDLVALHMQSPAIAEKLIKGTPYIKPRTVPVGDLNNPALQASQVDLVPRARAYQKAHEGITWIDAVTAVSEGKK